MGAKKRCQTRSAPSRKLAVKFAVFDQYEIKGARQKNKRIKNKRQNYFIFG